MFGLFLRQITSMASMHPLQTAPGTLDTYPFHYTATDVRSSGLRAALPKLSNNRAPRRWISE